MKDALTKQDESFLENIGIAGVLIALTCLMQHLVLMNEDNWISLLLIVVYLATIIGYVLLMKKNPAAPLLLLICGILLFLAEALFIIAQTYSLILLIQVLFTSATVVYVYVSGFPAKLKAKYLAKKAEKEKWEELI